MRKWEYFEENMNILIMDKNMTSIQAVPQGKLLQYSMLVTDNLSYGATVGASAANSNLIKFKT